MGGTEQPAPPTEPLAGPASLAVATTSARGPFATARACVRIRAARFSLANTGASTLTLAPPRIDPLHGQESGTGASGGLHGTLIVPADRLLAPGEQALVEISGTVPALPGIYAAAVRIETQGGGTLAIPLTVTVSASPFWGIAFMLLGLGVVGTTNALTGEGAVASQLRDALAARQLTHEWIERTPPPERLRRDMAEMDRHFDAAIAVLGERRALSVADHRPEDARANLQPALETAAKLRESLKDGSSAAAEAADLAHDWQDLQAQMRATAQAGRPEGPAAPGIAGQLDHFLYGWRQQFIGVPMQWVTLELTPHIDRVHLLLAAGQDEAARAQAIAVRRWMRQAAAMLDDRLHTWMGFAMTAGAIAAEDMTMRRQLAAADLPDATRAGLLGQLDAAAARLGEQTTPSAFAAAHQAILDAGTSLFRARAEQVKQHVRAAADRAAAEASIDRPEAVAQEVFAAKPATAADKIAAMTRILAAWRDQIAGVADGPARERLTARADALGKALADGDLTATPPLYHALLDAWSSWQAQHVKALTAPIVSAECSEQRDGLLRGVVVTQAQIRQRAAGPKQVAWEAELDRIRYETQQAAVDDSAAPDCLGVLGDLRQRDIALTDDVFTAMLSVVAIPDAARIATAEMSGSGVAIALTRQLATAPRPLILQPRTPPEERTVGRRIPFAVDNLDPLWGAGIQVAVDFGDGTPPLLLSAEAIRQGSQIEHQYATPRTLRARLRAAERFDSALTPQGRLFGEGETTLLLGPSPVTRAQALADAFLNARFALALLVASVVYYWRFHSGKKALGEKGFDYVEAFAVGFAASLAVTELPEKIAAFAPIKG
jgi:hypothetical protein